MLVPLLGYTGRDGPTLEGRCALKVYESTTKMYENGEKEGPKSTFATYIAEGEQLFHKGQYVKAIESFSTVSRFYICELTSSGWFTDSHHN